MRIKLLNTSDLSIIRKNTTGSFNDDGEWVEGAEDTVFNIKCSLQPFRQGEAKVDLPQGVTAKDVRVAYTKTELLTADEYLNQEPDETSIKGIPYQCYYVEDWNQYSLNNDHYKVFLVRKDKINVN